MPKLTVESFDHPIVFLFFLTLALIPTIALVGIGLKYLNLPGPAALFGQQASA